MGLNNKMAKITTFSEYELLSIIQDACSKYAYEIYMADVCDTPIQESGDFALNYMKKLHEKWAKELETIET